MAEYIMTEESGEARPIYGGTIDEAKRKQSRGQDLTFVEKIGLALSKLAPSGRPQDSTDLVDLSYVQEVDRGFAEAAARATNELEELGAIRDVYNSLGDEEKQSLLDMTMEWDPGRRAYRNPVFKWEGMGATSIEELDRFMNQYAHSENLRGKIINFFNQIGDIGLSREMNPAGEVAGMDPEDR